MKLIRSIIGALLCLAPAVLAQTSSGLKNDHVTTLTNGQARLRATSLGNGYFVPWYSIASRQRSTSDTITGTTGLATTLTYAADTTGLSHVVGQLVVGYSATPTVVAGTNEVDTLTIGGSGLGGTFTMTYAGQTTAAITWSATNATLLANINAALAALSTVGTSGWTATANSLTAGIGTITLTAGGILTTTPTGGASTFTANAASLTGSSPTAVVTQATAGVAPKQGGVTIQDGSGNTVFSAPILASGPVMIAFHVPTRGTANTAMIITLLAGGNGVFGSINAAHWTE